MLTSCSLRMIPLAGIIVIMIISSTFSASSSSSIVTVMADRHESLPCHEDNTETTTAPRICLRWCFTDSTILKSPLHQHLGHIFFVFSNPPNKQIIQTPKWPELGLGSSPLTAWNIWNAWIFCILDSWEWKNPWICERIWDESLKSEPGRRFHGNS